MDFERVMLTEEVIHTLDSEDLDCYVFDQIADKKKLTPEDDFAIVSRMDEIETALVATQILEGQVDNGGFNIRIPSSLN